jgi:RNA recognition motif-containing protein
MSFDTDENAVSNHFSQYGEITNIKLLSANGRSKGCGFVEFSKPAEA